MPPAPSSANLPFDALPRRREASTTCSLQWPWLRRPPSDHAGACAWVAPTKVQGALKAAMSPRS
eukprot:CAMPEP_0171117194 /NCGR_PEP_ID=MMETSP0766_2-20121228/91945_1 /TAXON_ID=439317 /ORGANISM="Gambierdiscus australes, Strain CAWD 149" /LENGTH=63 /DNA_ID=CAMNT_0011579693 /DNA_START=11 /DNA_END=199 /DNA_ORIENTATION=-